MVFKVFAEATRGDGVSDGISTLVNVPTGVIDMIDLLSPYVYIRDEHFEIVHAGPGLVAEFGEWDGRTCYEYFKGRLVPCEECLDPDVFPGGETYEKEIVTSGGRSLLFSTRTYDDGDGRRFVVGVGTDMTALKKAKADHEATAEALMNSEARQRALSVGSSDLCWIFDPDGMVNFVAPAVARLLGETEIDLIGRDVGDLFHGDDVEALRDVFTAAVAAPDVPVESSS